VTRGPAHGDRGELARENAELRAEIAALRSSTAFRLGHAVTRTLTRLRRQARAGTGRPTATTSSRSAAEAAGPSEGPGGAPAGIRPRRGETSDAVDAPAEPGAGPSGRLRRPPPGPALPTPAPAAHTWPLVPERVPTGPPEACPAGPVFVGGTGRSGTWAVGRLLGAHPEWVCIPTELRFHSVPSGFRAVLRGERTAEEFARGLHRRWYRLVGGEGKPKGLQMIVTPHELSSIARRFERRAAKDLPGALNLLMSELVAPFARGRGARGWTETTPANAGSVDALLTVFPRGRLVHTVRDGRDVAASVVTMPWGPDTIEDGLDWWAERVLAVDEAAAAVRDRVLTVRLEEFVHLDREAQFTRLMDFCGFADTDNLRRYFDLKIDRSRGHVARWRGEVAATERDRIDGRYRELLAQLTDLGVRELPVDVDALDDLASR
jgi:hypothetical protein